jgi:hypothetical protein
VAAGISFALGGDEMNNSEFDDDDGGHLPAEDTATLPPKVADVVRDYAGKDADKEFCVRFVTAAFEFQGTLFKALTGHVKGLQDRLQAMQQEVERLKARTAVEVGDVHPDCPEDEREASVLLCEVVSFFRDMLDHLVRDVKALKLAAK